MPISPRASPIGLPALRASSRASASASPSRASASREIACERPLGERARLEAHVVVRKGAWGMAMAVAGDPVGKVLLERPAERDVQHLHAPANPEHRHPALDGRAGERLLEAVALGPGAAHARM